MAETKTTIFFLCEAQDDSSPADNLYEELGRELLEPSMPIDLEYHLEAGSLRESGLMEHYVDLMAVVDLVVVDLTQLSASGHFLVGARQHLGLPIVYLCDLGFQYLPSHTAEQDIVWYSPENITQSHPTLAVAIRAALSASEPISDTSRRLELAERIETTAEAIRDLRINSAGKSVEQLLDIAAELRDTPGETPSRLKRAADKAIEVIGSLLDELASQPGARMAITAAISLIVGGTGVSGAAAFSAGLAFWYGPDVFRRWMQRRKD